MLSRTHKKPLEISLIPLINVVFLLLIFFLVAGVMQKPDIVPVAVPAATTGEHIAQQDYPMTVLLSEDQEMYLDDQRVSKEMLVQMLRYYLKQNPERMIVIKADVALKAERMTHIMREVALAGGKNLLIATELR